MPHLAWNEFVDGRTIGVVEEFHEKIKLDKEFDIKTPRKVGSEAAMEKLEAFMHKAQSKTTKAPDSEFIAPLASYLGDSTIQEDNSYQEKTELPQQSAYDQYSEKMMPSSEEIGRMIKYIKDFVTFYGVEPDEATQIVNSGYSVVFEAAVTSGIKVSLVTDVILKQIPYIRSEGLKTENLTKNRLIEIFSTFLKGEIKGKEEMYKCMIFATKNPSLSIPDIISKYFLRETPQKKVRKKKRKVEKTTHEVIEFKIPFHIEIIDGIITLPNTNGLGFKVNLGNINAEITFFYGGGSIGTSMIPTTLNIDEIIFLMAYEMNMVSLGYFEREMVTLRISARIIHEVIRILTEDNALQSTIQIENLNKGKKNILQLTIPFELPVTNIIPEGSYFVLPETDGVAFTVAKISEGYLLKFIQFKTPIGQIVIKDLVSEGNLRRILTENLQLPIWSKAASILACRIIHSSLKIMIKTGEKMIQQAKTVPAPIRKIYIQNEEKTSDKLLLYLDKLDSTN